MRVAQTNLQLYNQLRERGLPLAELVLVHRAYELATTLYAAHYQADGKPFVSHSVGVASILGALGQPAEILAVGVLHAVYGNADFGDGRPSGATPFRRRIVREAVGCEVEALVTRFGDLRIHHGNVREIRAGLPGRDDTERRLLLVDLADHLEKHVDLGPLYFGEDDWIVRANDRLGPELVHIARDLGEPELAQMLSAAIAEVSAERENIPPQLRASGERRYLTLVAPRSYRRRLAPALRSQMEQARHRLSSRIAKALRP